MPANSNSVPFLRYGLLQICFAVVLFLNFILSVAIILTQKEESGGIATRIEAADLILPSLIAGAVLLLISFVVLYILTFRARTIDLAGNIRIAKRSASFKVAFISWVMTSIESILRLTALFHFQDEALDYGSNAQWWSIAGYHMLLTLQTTLQVYCLYVYEKNTLICREGHGWMMTRKSFLILMTFVNCYFWLLNVAKIEVLVDLTSHKMEELFSGSLERIIYTLNRASTLAYHVESAQLFYKFYEQDSVSPLNNQYEDLDHEYPDYGSQIVETDSGKGAWLGFFMFIILLFVAIGSFLVRSGIHEVHYAATLSTVCVIVIIFCITLKTTLSVDNTEGEPQDQYSMTKLFEDITSYLAGEQISHLRILLFYSICAVSYHFLLTVRVSLRGGQMDVLQPVREGCKGVACISLTVFMFWMSHEKRKLRCWCDLNIMFWIVMTMLGLELVEETFEHDNMLKDPLQVYALPLAIDFKTYVIIHTFSDLTTAKAEYRRELRRDVENAPLLANDGNHSSRASTPSFDSFD